MLLYFTQIPGDVNTKGFMFGNDHFYFIPPFQRTELFELFDLFERRRGHLAIGKQKVPAVYIQADMFVHMTFCSRHLTSDFWFLILPRPAVPDPGNGRARKVESESFLIKDNLDHVGIKC